MKRYDVLVVGGGCAGVCAAIAAARQGKRTLLIEKQILLGGMAIMGRIHWLEPYCDGKDRQIIGGLAKEFFDRAVACGYSNLPKNWKKGEGRMASWFSLEGLCWSSRHDCSHKHRLSRWYALRLQGECISNVSRRTV